MNAGQERMANRHIVSRLEAFVTPRARRHLDGLMLRPLAETRSPIAYTVGRSIAECGGWTFPERENALEAFLAALYSNPDDSSAFDFLPDHVGELARRASEVLPPLYPDERRLTNTQFLVLVFDDIHAAMPGR